MQFFSSADLLEKSNLNLVNRGFPLYQHATALANEAKRSQDVKTYDIFLSHSFLDRGVIYGLKVAFETGGFSVYVDWVEDPTDRSKVTSANAELLRGRMKCSRSLVYATSDNAQDSKWMPWELGFFDGFRQKVAVCPITSNSSFEGREYLGLYPVVEKDFWMHKDGKLFKKLRDWIDA